MTIAIEAVEELINTRRRALSFPPALERQYEADSQKRRCARLKIGILVSASLYNVFLLADWLLVPDVFNIAAFLHIVVVTPWMLFAAWLVTRSPTPRIREAIAASVPLLIILQIDIGFAHTTSPSAAHYQYVILPTLLYTNVSLHRLPFRLACFVSAAAIILHSAVVISASYLSAPVAAMIIVQLVICAYITLIANYTLQRDARKAYLFSLRDRLRHSQAEEASRRDALTGLGNRHDLDVQLRSCWQNESLFVSIIMMDIDHFKRLNDRYGHGAGDICLKRVAAVVLEQIAGASAHAVRYGGEEFLVLLPDTQLVDAMRIAERIRRAVEEAAIPNDGVGPPAVVTASFGVAATLVSDLSAAELIAAADVALYAAKGRGRNRIWPPLAIQIFDNKVEHTAFVGRN